MVPWIPLEHRLAGPALKLLSPGFEPQDRDSPGGLGAELVTWRSSTLVEEGDSNMGIEPGKIW